MSPSALSEVLMRRKGLSSERGRNIAAKLPFPDWLKQHFTDQVTARHARHARSPRARALAEARLNAAKPALEPRLFDLETTNALTSWQDLAILELTNLKDFRPEASWIARRLGLNTAEVRRTVARLKRAGLLEVKRGRWIDRTPFAQTTDGVPNEAVCRFHQTLLRLAIEKLEDEPIERRFCKSMVFSIAGKNVDRAREILNQTVKQIGALANDSDANDRVLGVSVQLLHLSRGAE